MTEFELIDIIVDALGDVVGGSSVRVGPGDDAAVIAPPDGVDLIASIDSLVSGVHFPERAPPRLVGYRALMVSVSDLAAMGATPGYALVAVSVPRADARWVRDLARGLGEAARDCGIAVVGGNLARGGVCISVSVHGWAPPGTALSRSNAKAGDAIYVTGELGGAAAMLARGGLDDVREDELDALARRYFLPQPRLIAGERLRDVASAAIDVSDGLLQDLGHVCEASGVGAELELAAIPVAHGAQVNHALSGGDDYELCFTSSRSIPDLGCPVALIGRITAGPGIRIDGKAVSARGYAHFADDSAE